MKRRLQLGAGQHCQADASSEARAGSTQQGEKTRMMRIRSRIARRAAMTLRNAVSSREAASKPAASSISKGSGAPSVGRLTHRVAAAISACILILILISAPASHAVKYFDSFFGGSSVAPHLGGLFGTGNGGVGDIAVNDPAIVTDGGAQSGWTYVVDRGNLRVQAFDANQGFQFAIGRDVVQPGGAGDTNEKQTVTIGGTPTGGSFTLTFGANTTVAIPFDAPASGVGSVDEALEGIASVGAGNVDVTGSAGGPYAVEFVGARASVEQAQITANGSGLTPSGTATVVTTQDGASFEKCTVAAQCKVGTAPAITAAMARGNGGTFSIPQGIDIDQATGHIFVNERATSTSGAGAGNRRVQEFTATGDFVRAFGWDVAAPAGSNSFETCNAAANDICQPAQAAGTANGQVGNSTQAINGLAVAPPGAPNAGNVYVADPANRRVLPFGVPASPTGSVTPGAPFGSAVQFPQANWPRDVAADSNGIVYAGLVASTGSASGQDGQVARFETIGIGGFKTPISPGFDDAFFDRSPPTSLEIDQATGHLFAGRAPGSGGDGPAFAPGVVELDLSSNPTEVDVSHMVDFHGVGLGLVSTSSPLAMGVGAGRIFLSVGTGVGVSGTGTGNRVVVLDDDGVDPPPTTTLQPPASVGCTSATFGAQINPNGPTGFPTSYRFELSKDGISWTTATTDQSVGDGGAPVMVDDDISGLEANTVYRVRVVTTRSPAAGTVASPELIFVTDPCAPTVETIAEQHVGDTTAQLLGRINPNGLETTYWFEWGDDSYGNMIPVPSASAGSGSVAKIVGESLTGLDPESVYHFRACARNVLVPDKICGADDTFTTRPASGQVENRALEMVTSPEKVLRRGGEVAAPGASGDDYSRHEIGLPSVDGDSLLWSVYSGVSDPDAGAGWSGDRVYEVRSREDSDGDGNADGWYGEAAIGIPPPTQANGAINDFISVSPDLVTQGWNIRYSLFDNDSESSTHVMGDEGGPRGAGWYPWLDPAWHLGLPVAANGFAALIDDQGQRLVGWDEQTGADDRNIIPADGTLSPGQLTPPQTSGRAPFLSGPEGGWRPDDLVSECTGAEIASTEILTRNDNGTPSGPAGSYDVNASYSSGSTTINVFGVTSGTPLVGHIATGSGIPSGATIVATNLPTSFTISVPAFADVPFGPVSGGVDVAKAEDDTIGVRDCAAGSPTSTRGATLGAHGADVHLVGARITALSDGGTRVFFTSPDPISNAQGGAPRSCVAGDGAVGTGTDCPPQLFVRQYDDEGNPTVRWISRAEDALFDASQRVSELGNGISFEGASRDGRVAFFRTNAPLTSDDPNSGDDSVTGTASRSSWDLYRYEFPGDNNVDPAGGELTRISGGPGGTADPNTNCAIIATSGGDDGNCSGSADSSLPNGAGSTIRFMSDDGDRVYFVTSAEIPGALNASPRGGVTSPTSASSQLNQTTRNLYLYDESKPGAAGYEFIARIPFVRPGSDGLDGCVSSESSGTAFAHTIELIPLALRQLGSCVHGTRSGDALVFETTASLTADDTDAAGDVYLYDATADELVRLSAPPPGAASYPCLGDASAPTTYCNGDLGIDTRTENMPGNGRGVGQTGMRNLNLAENTDGTMRAVYFESRLPFVSDDTNGDRMDVYEWRAGRISLVSPGSADFSAFYTGNSQDGRDVFFWTEQRISAWEIDDGDGDVYVARVGGGLPDPPEPPPICDPLADGCQGGGFEAVPSDTKTSSSSESENVSSGPRKSLSLRKLAASQRRKAARSGVISLRVRSNAAGKLSLSARAKLGKRTFRVGRKTVRIRKAGTTRVDLRLNSAAKRRLRSGKKLRLTVEARQSGARTRTLTVTLKRGKKS